MNNVNKLLVSIAMTPFLLFGSAVLAANDAEITSRVESKISDNASISKSDIKVNTTEGVVVLKGDVNTEKEANTAIEEAYSVPDVKDVDTTDLMVKSAEKSEHPYKDSYITAKVKGSFVREKLFGDKSVDVSGVSVETKDGVVYLSGTADTEAQINTAISLAKKIKGVTDVQSTVVVNK
jgi:hyperosmotically inducible protein